MLKDENEKDIQEKIDEFLREIDALYPAKWSKLQYEKYNLEEKNDDRNYDNVILEFKRDKNSIRKIRYLSRLSTAKIVDLKDSFKFNISIPKEGKLIIKEIEEHDSTKEAWEFYKRKYGEYLDLEDKEIKFGNEISFKVHGETDFNFALDKVDEFIYIIDNDKKPFEEKREFAKKLLNICAYFNYSLLNFSIIPSEGNLQGTKGTIGKDRFDVFVWALNLYYKEGVDLIINSHTSVQSTKKLIKILDYFNEKPKFNGYFVFFYDLDEDITSGLIESGKKRIDTTDRVIEYMMWAFKVWRIRYDKFSENEQIQMLGQEFSKVQKVIEDFKAKEFSRV